VNQKRPVNLDLTTMKFPAMAIASILHRLSGIALFLLMPFVLCVFSLSLKDEVSFFKAQQYLANPYAKLLFWLFAASLIYHLLAGIRHLIMDLGFGEEVKTSRLTAILVIGLSVILAIFLGIWIW